LLFALSRFGFHRTFYFYRDAFLLLKWGWKSFGLPRYFGFHRDAFFCCTTILLFFTAALFFGVSRSFNFYRDAFFWIHHNRVVSTELSSFKSITTLLFLPCRPFCCATIFLYFTEMLSFVISRYFWIHRDAIFLLHHDTFWFAQTPFAWTALTPLLSCAAIGSTDVETPQKFGRSTELEIMPRWPRQRAARR
jgi:hypothetical protein